MRAFNIGILYLSLIVEIQYQHNKEILDFLSYRESMNTLSAIGCNTNGTRDWGLYQLNDVTFLEMQNRGYGIVDKQVFLNDILIQRYYASVLLHIHRQILKQHNIPLTKSNLIRSWGGVYNFQQYSYF